jgi:hypothetical protein
MGILQKRAHARLVADFTTEIEPSEKYLAFGFGLAGEIVVASRRSEESPTVEKEHGIFPKSQLEGASDYRVLVKRDEQPLKRIVIRSERTPCSFVQHVPDGLLMVGARCAWRVSGPEQNAVVFDESGKVVRRFTLGDGINDVRTDSKGSIWVSYFDEGVFGNRGWNSPGPEPIGASGLVAFDSSGQRIFFRCRGCRNGHHLRCIRNESRRRRRRMGLFLHGVSNRSYSQWPVSALELWRGWSERRGCP